MASLGRVNQVDTICNAWVHLLPAGFSVFCLGNSALFPVVLSYCDPETFART